MLSELSVWEEGHYSNPAATEENWGDRPVKTEPSWLMFPWGFSSWSVGTIVSSLQWPKVLSCGRKACSPHAGKQTGQGGVKGHTLLPQWPPTSWKSYHLVTKTNSYKPSGDTLHGRDFGANFNSLFIPHSCLIIQSSYFPFLLLRSQYLHYWAMTAMPSGSLILELSLSNNPVHATL